MPARSRAASTSDDIEDYYLTPYDLGYGRSVAFDHDFIGRAALEQHAAGPQRTKVTLVWNPDDVAAAQRSLYEPGTPAKYIDFPKARYGIYQVDRVLADGTDVGISHDAGYITGEQVFVSLASVDAAHAEPGTEVVVVWGEEPVSAKPAVEPHRQVADPRHGLPGAVLVVRAGELPQELTTADASGPACRRHRSPSSAPTHLRRYSAGFARRPDCVARQRHSAERIVGAVRRGARAAGSAPLPSTMRCEPGEGRAGHVGGLARRLERGERVPHLVLAADRVAVRALDQPVDERSRRRGRAPAPSGRAATPRRRRRAPRPRPR